MRIKISRSQWEKIGQKAKWNSSGEDGNKKLEKQILKYIGRPDASSFDDCSVAELGKFYDMMLNNTKAMVTEQEEYDFDTVIRKLYKVMRSKIDRFNSYLQKM